MLALWLELSVSIVLYCGEVVALLVADADRTPDEQALPHASAASAPPRPSSSAGPA